MSNFPWFELFARRAQVSYTPRSMRALFVSEPQNGCFELLAYFDNAPNSEEIELVNNIIADIVGSVGAGLTCNVRCLSSDSDWNGLEKLRHSLYVRAEEYPRAYGE